MPSKKIILMVSIGTLLMGCMNACVEEKSTQDPTGSISAAVTRNGLPNDKDSCPDHDSPPNFDLDMSCTDVSDCTNVPVACVDPLHPSEATCEPVWVGCKSNRCVTQPNNDWDAFGDVCDPDDDQDGYCDPGVTPPPMETALVFLIPVECDGTDNCQWVWNPDQINTDMDQNATTGDMLGDACDDDDDNDGDADDNDTCPTTPNADQSDMDNDGDGDACDDDDDNDGDADDNDTCPTEWNPWQEDNDLDAIPGVGGGDACDDDDDDDNVTDDDDNCPTVSNPDQADFDDDGEPGGTDDPMTGGDACDRDCTGDGVEEMEEDEEFPNWACNGTAVACTVDNQATACNDSNSCTTDTCPAGTCVHTNNTDSCDDGLHCNGADTCGSGSCQHSGNPCQGADGDSNCAESCDEDSNNCLAADPNGSNCDDGLYCTMTDTCSGGVCGGTGDPCLPLNTTDSNCQTSCNEGANNCSTADPNDTGCNDGNSCTSGDMCTGGTCGGTPVAQCGSCGGITCEEGDSCQGNRCVAPNEELWCWDSGSPASCKTHSGYDSPVIWEYDMSPSAPPKCTGPDQQWSPNPLCCVAVDPLPQGNIPCTTQPANPYAQ